MAPMNGGENFPNYAMHSYLTSLKLFFILKKKPVLFGSVIIF